MKNSQEDHQTSEAQYYSAIGRFVVQFSQLEMILKLWISETVGIPHQFQNEIMTQDFALLCTIAQKVLPTGKAPEATATLKPIISEFRKLNDERVRIVHGWWLVGGARQFLSHVSRSQLQLNTHYEHASQIEALSARIDQLDLDLRSWNRSNRARDLE